MDGVNAQVISKARQQRSSFLLWLIPLIFLLVFFFTPLGKIFVVLFGQKGIVSLKGVLSPLWFTIWQAVLSTIITLLIGLPVAFIFSRYSFPGKKLIRNLTTLPFILPTVVVAAAFNTFLGPKGWLNLILIRIFNLDNPPVYIINTLAAILIAHVFYNLSVVIRVVVSAWTQLDTKLENAGSVLGASPWGVFREITFPLLKKPILVAALLVFLFDFTSFGVVLLLGGPHFSTLEVSIYTQTLSLFNLRMAGVLSAIQLACTFLVTYFYSRLNSGLIIPLFPRLRGEGLKTPKRIPEKVFIWVSCIFLVVFIILPLGSLLLRSFTNFETGSVGNSGFTLEFYKALFINPQQSIFYVPPIKAALNSIYYGMITVVISVVMGLLLTYAFVNNNKSRRWLESLIMLPLGASAVTLGLGFLITFDRAPLDVKTFPLLIPIVHSLVAIPFVVRILQPALASIPDSLRQAAAVLGARPSRIWWQVDLPILRRALIAGVIFSFTISLGEFGATTFLARPETPTLPIAIFRFLSQPGAMNYGQAIAMSSILMLVCGLSVALLEKLEIQGQAGF